MIFVVAAYVTGSIPFGFIIGRSRGLDVRAVGSGNIGATNVSRAAGRALGVMTFVLDGVKGAVVPALALATGQPPRVAVVAGFAAVFGHCFSVFLSLRGGKGVSTFVGTFTVLEPVAALAGAVAFAGTLFLLRYVALASMALLVMVVAVSAWRHGPAEARTVMAAVSTVLVGMRHWQNWTRMWHGTERKMARGSDAVDERHGVS